MANNKENTIMAVGAWMSFDALIDLTAGKKIVFWGCFDFFEKSMKKYAFPVEFLVDINTHLHGKKSHHGFDVKDPSVLEHLEPKSDYFIIVSSSAFYEIFKVLEKYGFAPGKHFAATPLLNDMRIIDDFYSINSRVIFSSSDASRDLHNRGGGLYQMDMGTGVIEKKISGVTRGFAFYEGSCFVADADKGVRVLDQSYEDIDCIKLPHGAYPHGIAIDAKKKRLYLVLSRFDQVHVYDIESLKEIDIIKISNKYERSGRSFYQHHINDICVDGDSLYISMFSRTGTMQVNWYNGTILDFDTVDKVVLGEVASGLWMPHSPKVLKDSLAFLNSMRGELYLESHKVESRFNGFVRGLDFDGKYYYIGQSIHRYFDLMKDTSNNISVDAGIHVYEPMTHASRFFPTPTIKDINTLIVTA